MTVLQQLTTLIEHRDQLIREHTLALELHDDDKILHFERLLMQNTNDICVFCEKTNLV